MACKRSAVRSRLAPPSNSLLDGVFLNNKVFRFGAIAQLGERLHGMQEVSGSIPLSSTIISFYFIFHKVNISSPKISPIVFGNIRPYPTSNTSQGKPVSSRLIIYYCAV